MQQQILSILSSNMFGVEQLSHYPALVLDQGITIYNGNNISNLALGPTFLQLTYYQHSSGQEDWLKIY